MADIERLVLNLYTMGEILVAQPSTNPMDPTEGLFVLSSGEPSAFYFSGRDITGFSKGSPLSMAEQLATREIAIEAFDELLQGQRYDHLYPIPQAATALGSMVAYRRQDSLLWGRVGTKNHGVQAPVQGNYSVGDRVATLDNVITKSGSAAAAAETLEGLGLIVPSLFVLVERDAGGSQALQNRGPKPPITVHSAIGERAMLDILIANGRVSPKQQDLIDRYRLQS